MPNETQDSNRAHRVINRAIAREIGAMRNDVNILIRTFRELSNTVTEGIRGLSNMVMEAFRGRQMVEIVRGTPIQLQSGIQMGQTSVYHPYTIKTSLTYLGSYRDPHGGKFSLSNEHELVTTTVSIDKNPSNPL